MENKHYHDYYYRKIVNISNLDVLKHYANDMLLFD